MNDLRVIAHRGIRGPYTENSLDGFKAAAKTKADAIEFDVQATKDGQLVVLHSMSSPRKVFGITQPLANLTWVEVKKYKSPKGERMPTFEEVLKVLQNKPVVIDIKDIRSARLIAEKMSDQEARRVAVVNSLYPEALKIIKTRFPNLNLSLHTYTRPLNAIKIAKREGFSHVTYPLYLMNTYVYWRVLHANLRILVYQNYVSFLLNSRLFTKILRLIYPSSITIISDRADKIAG